MFFKRNAVLVIVLLNVTSVSVIATNINIFEETIADSPGIPLLLTPLIDQNKIEEALIAAQTHFNGFGNIKSYAGYFTVNKLHNSNLYFWFFPSTNDYENAPVILWLQGGPGESSLIGLFVEHGPFKVKSQHGLELRPYTWINSHSVIYVDNPVGTGFSFTNEGYAQNQTEIVEDLYNFLQQFFKLFPELEKNKFYVAGEGYAGKFVVSLCYAIHENNLKEGKINFQGLCVGNGFIDPENQLNYGDYLYQIGLVDETTGELLKNYSQQVTTFIQNREFSNAFNVFDEMIEGYFHNNASIFKNVSGFTNILNFLYPVDPSAEILYMNEYIQRNDVRAAMHVGNATFYNGFTVRDNLKNDYMQSVASLLPELLSYYRVLIYNGQLDILAPYPLVENYLQNLEANYANTPRREWIIDGDLGGYVKKTGNLTEVLVRNAGHRVCSDQPVRCYDLISRFTQNKNFTKY